ncbi:MAG: winged helix-turn-helix domain-containing protein, partial [Candidatus Acidiferrum sp.]
MAEVADSRRFVRFGSYEVDLPAGELKKCGVRLKLSGQPFQVLAILLEQPGTIVTREELQKRLWPDTFVDVDHKLNTAINKIREALGDSSDNPRFVETLPRRGYRFIAPMDRDGNGAKPATITTTDTAGPRRWRILGAPLLLGALTLLVSAGFFIYKGRNAPAAPLQRTLTRITFDDGLQIGATWSPDGRFLAYSSERGGKFDIWVQQVSGGDPIQITKGPGQNWQPDWSPDGKYIAYRCEEDAGGIYITPALGGEGQQRKVASFGYHPRWSPDSTRILFQSSVLPYYNRIYAVTLDGGAPREVLAGTEARRILFAAWHPDGKRITAWTLDPRDEVIPLNFLTESVEGGALIQSRLPPELYKQIEAVALGAEWRMDYKFAWAPSGRAIYFEGTFRGARNIW